MSSKSSVVSMKSEFNAKTRRGKDAKEDGENGSQTNAHRLVTRLGNANFFFAPLPLCVEILCLKIPHRAGFRSTSYPWRGESFSRNVLALSRAMAQSAPPSDFLAVAAWWIFN
jgi:hypothetical protein